MHIALFKALRSAKVSDDQATKVVEALEEYIAMKVTEANAKLEAQLRAQNWLLGFIGILLAIIGLAPAIAKLF